MDKNTLRLYAVTDRRWLSPEKPLWEAVEQAIEGGVTFVQLREKDLRRDAVKEEALEVQEICERIGIPFVVNDDVRLAQEIAADGVHLGQGDMSCRMAREILGPDKIIGVTAKTVEQALKAQADGADYLGCGAVFGSGTKTDTSFMSRETLSAITAAVDIPVIAIGGITAENIRELKGTGIAGVAVVSAIFAAKDIRKAAEELSGLAAEISESV